MSLRKELGLVHVFCIATGAMVSSGIFVLPGMAHAQAGPAAILSYLIAGLLAMTGVFSIAELATAMPKAGGDYFFVARGIGPAVGTVAGLLTWFSLSLKSSFALVGLTAFIAPWLDVNPQLLGVAACAGFVLLNAVGTRHAGRFQVVLVMALLAAMLLYIARGLPVVNLARLEPFVPHGFNSVLFTAGFVFVAYGGLLKVSSVAEEVREPGRTIPLGMILSLLVVSVFYTLMMLVTSAVVPAEQLNQSLTPISDGAALFMGPAGRAALNAAAMLAFVTTANAGVMAAARYLLAMSRDELLPGLFGRVHRRFHSPHTALLSTGVFVAGALFLQLDILVEAASLVLLLSYILACACVIVMRESRVQNYLPRFRSPLYPWPQLIGIIGFTMLIFELGMVAFYICAALMAAGFSTYWLYGRKRAQRDYALQHLVGRIASRDVVTSTLETELKQIIRERDDIHVDRFDRLLATCPVFDLKGEQSVDEVLRQAAETLADRVAVPSSRLYQLFQEREAQSSTVLLPHLAVPHVVIPGERVFELLLVRASGGIRFSDESPCVTAVFVLAGTRDERNFHLRALASIAQIVYRPDFEKKWLAARNEQGLRDLLLLGERRREE